MKNYFENIYGNAECVSYFSAAIAAGRLAHAYIIEGPAGSGKRTLAKAIAAQRVEDSPFADKIGRGQSPDLACFGLADKKKTIGVDTVRALNSEVYIKPSELDAKFFIITDCHAMTVQAQNAALKILEEPPQNVYFFLLTESAAALLPTVRSRAQTIRMQTFTDKELAVYALRDPKWRSLSEKEPLQFQKAIAIAGGCIGKLQENGEDKERLSQKEKAERLIALLDAGEYAPLLTYCAALTKSRTELDAILLATEQGLRDALAVRSGMHSPLMLYSTSGQAQDATRHLTSGGLLGAVLEIEQTREFLTCNPNIKGVQALLADNLLRSIQK